MFDRILSTPMLLLVFYLALSCISCLQAIQTVLFYTVDLFSAVEFQWLIFSLISQLFFFCSFSSFFCICLVLESLVLNPLNVLPHIETSQLICTANQLTGFYMRGHLMAQCLKNFFLKFVLLAAFVNCFVFC